MDLYAYMLMPKLEGYVKKVCGELPPRLRGLRLMKVETSEDFDAEDFTYAHNRQFSELCGKDYIYIHTRCGGSDGDDESNYHYFGMDEWEKEHGAFGIDDGYDHTYRDTYIPAVVNDTYKELIAELEKLER